MRKPKRLIFRIDSLQLNNKAAFSWEIQYNDGARSHSTPLDVGRLYALDLERDEIEK